MLSLKYFLKGILRKSHFFSRPWSGCELCTSRWSNWPEFLIIGGRQLGNGLSKWEKKSENKVVPKFLSIGHLLDTLSWEKQPFIKIPLMKYFNKNIFFPTHQAGRFDLSQPIGIFLLTFYRFRRPVQYMSKTEQPMLSTKGCPSLLILRFFNILQKGGGGTMG